MPDARSPDFRAGRDKRGPDRPEAIGAIRHGRGQAAETVAGCEALAASALARASTMDTYNGQLRLEHSAASWQERAALLQRLETGASDRLALDKAEWKQADADELLYEANQDADHDEL